jgi:hypothetical protein
MKVSFGCSLVGPCPSRDLEQSLDNWAKLEFGQTGNATPNHLQERGEPRIVLSLLREASIVPLGPGKARGDAFANFSPVPNGVDLNLDNLDFVRMGAYAEVRRFRQEMGLTSKIGSPGRIDTKKCLRERIPAPPKNRYERYEKMHKFIEQGGTQRNSGRNLAYRNNLFSIVWNQYPELAET